MPLPVVQPEIINALHASGYDHEATLHRILKENPQVMVLLQTLEKTGRQEAISGVILLYRLLASQAEANEMRELYD